MHSLTKPCRPRPAAAASIAALFLLIGTAAPAQAGQNGSDILAAVDSYRDYDAGGYSFDFATSGSEGSSLMRVSVRTEGDGAALVRYLEPAKDRGRLVLVRGNSFWLLDPGMKKSLRISPRQLIFGQASAGDITRISFGAMYDIAVKSDVPGGVILKLKAKKDAGATYDLVDLRTDEKGRPIEAACMGRSGALIKTISYEKFETIGGKELLTGFSIKDEASGDSERVRISGFDASLPPDSAFTVQGMRFQK